MKNYYCFFLRLFCAALVGLFALGAFGIFLGRDCTATYVICGVCAFWNLLVTAMAARD